MCCCLVNNLVSLVVGYSSIEPRVPPVSTHSGWASQRMWVAFADPGLTELEQPAIWIHHRITNIPWREPTATTSVKPWRQSFTLQHIYGLGLHTAHLYGQYGALCTVKMHNTRNWPGRKLDSFTQSWSGSGPGTFSMGTEYSSIELRGTSSFKAQELAYLHAWLNSF